MIDFYTPTEADEAYAEGRAILRELNRTYATAEYLDLADGELERRYEALAQAFEALAAEARSIVGHRHAWNSDDYCNICGADGRS